MSTCSACGKDTDDLYNVNGVKVCEECAISKGALSSPSKPCGPGK